MHGFLPESHFTLFSDMRPINALELFLPTCLLMLGNQSMYQKFFSAKSEKDARNATLGWVVGTVILEWAIVALAVVGSAMYKSGEVAAHPREVLAYTATHAFSFSPGIGNESLPRPDSNFAAYALQLLGALLVGAIFAKVVSTANNYLFSPATNLVNDIYARYIRPHAANKEVLIISRFMVALLGVWALIQALQIKSVLAMSLYAYTIYSAALTPVILAAFFWRRATAKAAVASIAAGTAVTVGWDRIAPHLPSMLAERDAILPALIVSVLCLFIVSLATKPPSAEKLAPFA